VGFPAGRVQAVLVPHDDMKYRQSYAPRRRGLGEGAKSICRGELDKQRVGGVAGEDKGGNPATAFLFFRVGRGVASRGSPLSV